MQDKETNARIIIDKMLLEASWKLPGYVDNKDINVQTETNNEFGRADYILLNSNKKNLCTVEAKKYSKRFFHVPKYYIAYKQGKVWKSKIFIQNTFLQLSHHNVQRCTKRRHEDGKY